jgi:hypothetical protein
MTVSAPSPAAGPLNDILGRTPVSTLDDVLATLTAIANALPANDGVAAFSSLYRDVTAAVRTATAGATFNDLRWLQRLDVVFGNLYFQALRQFLANDPRTPRAWYPLFADRDNPRKSRAQMAFAGINAHINRDLPVALVQVCSELGVELSRSAPEYHDYTAVNPILAQVETQVKASLLSGALAAVDGALGKTDDILANWSIDEARTAAWTNGEALWALRPFPSLSDRFLDSLDGLVGFAGRGLLVTL